jgi:high-affinity nickel permease
MTALFGPTLLRSLRVHGDSQSQNLARGNLTGLLTIVALGFVLGMRHARDVDHVVAISTMVARRRSISGAALVGAVWGVGHTITIMVVGVAIVAFGVVIPAAGSLDGMAVRLMLVILGVMKRSGAPLGSITTKERLPLDEIEQIRL